MIEKTLELGTKVKVEVSNWWLYSVLDHDKSEGSTTFEGKIVGFDEEDSLYLVYIPELPKGTGHNGEGHYEPFHTIPYEEDDRCFWFHGDSMEVIADD